MRQILTVFLLLFSAALVAQEVSLKGRINTADSLEVFAVHVVNLSKEKGTVTAADGEFKITVTENDTLLFSSVQYKKEEVIVTRKILEQELLEVFLTGANELDEVNLHKLSGNLDDDLSGIKTSSPSDFGLPVPAKKPPTIEERKLSSLSSPMDPVGLVWGSVSGERKKLKKAIQNNKEEDRVLKARNFLPESFFTEELKLPKNQILNFLHYCAENPIFGQLVKERKQLELIELYQESVEPFLSFYNLD